MQARARYYVAGDVLAGFSLRVLIDTAPMFEVIVELPEPIRVMPASLIEVESDALAVIPVRAVAVPLADQEPPPERVCQHCGSPWPNPHRPGCAWKTWEEETTP